MAHDPGLAPREAATQILTRFATRAYRRPVVVSELDRVIALFDQATEEGERFELAVRRSPKLIIGVPVGFVNVIESKELIMKDGIPYIVARGRKGGSNVAAAIVNALLYMASPREEE
jgi:precorrin-8X/cobalt-precorrin-8 methylmutase